MQTVKSNLFAIIGSSLFILFSLFAFYVENWFYFLTPFALLIIYISIYHTKYVFLFILFATPLSINIEEFVTSVGLYVPTEPLLFGLLLLVILYQLRSNFIPTFVFKNEIIWAIGIYLAWIFISACMSTHPLVSFKFLLVKLWYVVPLIGFGAHIYTFPKSTICLPKLFYWVY